MVRSAKPFQEHVYFRDHNPMVSCPFNVQHRVAKSRLQLHIIKCSKNYPNHFVCPYNALHRFLTKDDHTKHITACPDMSFMMSWKYDKPEQHGNLQQTPFHMEGTRAFNLELENWSAEYQ